MIIHNAIDILRQGFYFMAIPVMLIILGVKVKELGWLRWVVLSLGILMLLAFIGCVWEAKRIGEVLQ